MALCYSDVVNKKGITDASVSLKFMINREGLLEKIKITDASFKDKEFYGCLKESVNGLSFPIAKGGGVALVTYPIFFEVQWKRTERHFVETEKT